MIDKVRTSIRHEAAALETTEAKQAALEEGYRQMAADLEHEMEAEEWTQQILFDIEAE
jgi:hypothetical protein